MKSIFLLCAVLLFSGCFQSESPNDNSSKVEFDKQYIPTETEEVFTGNLARVPKKAKGIDVVAYVGEKEIEVELKPSQTSKKIEGAYFARSANCRYLFLSQCRSSFRASIVDSKASFNAGNNDESFFYEGKNPYLALRFNNGDETLPAILLDTFFPNYGSKTLNRNSGIVNLDDSFYFVYADYLSASVWRSKNGVYWNKIHQITMEFKNVQLNVLGDKLVLSEDCDVLLEKRKKFLWISKDGRSWEKELIPFKTCWYESMVFDNKLWFIIKQNQFLGQEHAQIWSYPNSRLWKKETDIPLLDEAEDFRLGQFNNQMVLISNFGSSQSKYTNISVSLDGKHWNMLENNLLTQSSNNLNVNYTLTEYEGKLWLYSTFGSSDLKFPAFNQIWHSKDLENWVLEPYQLSANLVNVGKIIKHKNKLWMLDTQTKEILSSKDAINWQLINSSNHLSSDMASVSLHDGLVRLYSPFGDVIDYLDWPYKKYKKTDARHDIKTSWGPLIGSNYFPFTYMVDDIVKHEGRYWVFLYRKELKTTWIFSSHNGIDWKLETDNPSFGNIEDYQVSSFKGRLWLIGGHKVGQRKYLDGVWSSEDGKNWQLEPSLPNWGDGGRTEAIVFDNELWVFVSRGLLHSSDAARVYSSVDGVTWRERIENKNIPFSKEYGQKLFVFKNKMWRIGEGFSFPHSAFFVDGIWNSDDGVNWNLATARHQLPFHFPKLNILTFTYDGYIWVIGRDVFNTTNSLVWHSYRHDIWRSKDGRNWQKVVNTTLSETIR